MYYLSNEQEKALEIINRLKCIREDQLLKFKLFKSGNVSISKKIESFRKLSYNKNQAYFNIKGDVYTSINNESIDYQIIKAIDILQLFDDVKWYCIGDYPFKLTFSRGSNNDNKIFDICFLSPGEEIILIRTLEKAITERVIVVLNYNLVKLDKYKEIKANSNIGIRYCIFIDDKILFYKSIKDIKEAIL